MSQRGKAIRLMDDARMKLRQVVNFCGLPLGFEADLKEIDTQIERLQNKLMKLGEKDDQV